MARRRAPQFPIGDAPPRERRYGGLSTRAREILARTKAACAALDKISGDHRPRRAPYAPRKVSEKRCKFCRELGHAINKCPVVAQEARDAVDADEKGEGGVGEGVVKKVKKGKSEK